LEGYLADQGAAHGEVWRILQEELWPYRHPGLYRFAKSARKLSLEAKELFRALARRVLPAAARQWLRNQSGIGKSYE
jgi:hypothetical protein